MRFKQNFTVEELRDIERAKELFNDLRIHERHIQYLEKKKEELEVELQDLGYKGPKLSRTPGGGSKPRCKNGCRDVLMDLIIEELRQIESDISAVYSKMQRTLNAVEHMPTRTYRDVLVKKYVIGGKTTHKDWNMRYNHLDDAYLEFFQTYYG